MTAYVSEFCIAIRHPEHEAGQESTFHVVLTRWEQDLSGAWLPRAVGPMSPERAESLGFSLDKILGEVNAAAVRDAEASRKLANDKAVELEKAQEVAAQAVQQAAEAIKSAEVFQSLAASALVEKAALADREAALMQEIAALTAPKETVISKVTFGLIQKI